jgi:integrase
MYMTAQDIDFENRLVHVRAKPEWKWEPKDKEERSIPVPNDLLAKLKAHIASGPADQRLLFPLAKDRKKPDKHLLRRLKVSAFQAGLNCGHCVAKNGKRCADQPVCK